MEIISLADSIKFEKSHPPDVLALLIAKHLSGERCYLETTGGHPVILSEHLFDNTDCCVYCGKFKAITSVPLAEDEVETAMAELKEIFPDYWIRIDRSARYQPNLDIARLVSISVDKLVDDFEAPTLSKAMQQVREWKERLDG